MTLILVSNRLPVTVRRSGTDLTCSRIPAESRRPRLVSSRIARPAGSDGPAPRTGDSNKSRASSEKEFDCVPGVLPSNWPARTSRLFDGTLWPCFTLLHVRQILGLGVGGVPAVTRGSGRGRAGPPPKRSAGDPRLSSPPSASLFGNGFPRPGWILPSHPVSRRTMCFSPPVGTGKSLQGMLGARPDRLPYLRLRPAFLGSVLRDLGLDTGSATIVAAIGRASGCVPFGVDVVKFNSDPIGPAPAFDRATEERLEPSEAAVSISASTTRRASRKVRCVRTIPRAAPSGVGRSHLLAVVPSPRGVADYARLNGRSTSASGASTADTGRLRGRRSDMCTANSTSTSSSPSTRKRRGDQSRHFETG